MQKQNFVNQPKKEITYLLHDGTSTKEVQEKDKFKVVGRIVETANLKRFFLRVVGTKLHDPKAFSVTQLKNEMPYFQEVNERAYDLYDKYINNKSRTNISSIERIL